MYDLILVAVLFGPLVALGAYQFFGVRRLTSKTTAKVFLWGLVFAAVPLPLLVLLELAPFAVQQGDFFAAAWRQIFIWLMIFGLVLFTRIGLMLFSWLWKKRPKASPAQA